MLSVHQEYPTSTEDVMGSIVAKVIANPMVKKLALEAAVAVVEVLVRQAKKHH